MNYLDLLAGPGKCILRDTKEEIDGSPLRALKVQPPFDHLYLSDRSPKYIEILNNRISEKDKNRVTCKIGDCNKLAGEFLKEISSRDLTLAFLDPEGFEVHFDTLVLLATRQIDILYLFPSGMGIKRNFARFLKSEHSKMDEILGSSEWRTAKSDQVSHLAVKFFRQAMERIGYIYQDNMDPYITNEQNVSMYHLLFFSKNVAGLNIWKGIKKIESSGQRLLFTD